MFNGILPPLPTPFKEDGALDLEALRSNVEKLNVTGLTGYVALGTNSEAVHVTPEEASQVFVTVKKAAAPGKIVIAGTGQPSTVATLAVTKRAADAGCDAALIVTPFYYKNSMTGETLKKRYTPGHEDHPAPARRWVLLCRDGLRHGRPRRSPFRLGRAVGAREQGHRRRTIRRGGAPGRMGPAEGGPGSRGGRSRGAPPATP